MNFPRMVYANPLCAWQGMVIIQRHETIDTYMWMSACSSISLLVHVCSIFTCTNTVRTQYCFHIIGIGINNMGYLSLAGIDKSRRCRTAYAQALHLHSWPLQVMVMVPVVALRCSRAQIVVAQRLGNLGNTPGTKCCQRAHQLATFQLVGFHILHANYFSYAQVGQKSWKPAISFPKVILVHCNHPSLGS